MITFLAIMVSAIFVILCAFFYAISEELTKIRKAIEAYVYEETEGD